MISAPMPAPAESDAWGRALGREFLDSALLDAAARSGAEVLQPCSVQSWRRDANGYRVVLAGPGGESCERVTRTIIAAHGSWERGALDSQAERLPARGADLLGFKAHFTGAALAPGLMPLVLFPGGYGGLVHSDAGRTSFSCCIRRDALRCCRAEHRGLSAGEALIAHVAESCRGVREAIAGARREAAWLSAGPIRPGIRALARGGVFAVGNAAGEAHPLVAEGISMAIQSAWLLAAGIAAEDTLSRGAIDAIGRRYARAWRRNFAGRVRASAAFAALTTSPATAGASIAVLRLAPALLTLGAWWSGKAHTLRRMEALS
jgi:2-polyprenyl-6-methoxyphenol hydroxylase-like FAD-dependent oxidoreductase